MPVNPKKREGSPELSREPCEQAREPIREGRPPLLDTLNIRRATISVKQNIARTPGSLLPGSFRPESFTDHLEGLSKSELVAIIVDAREFGIGIIHAEYEQFEEVVDDASNGT